MRLLEHQSKSLLSEFGLKFNPWVLVCSQEEMETALDSIELPVMVKAQAPFSGRAKAGAVKEAETKEAAFECLEELLSATIRGARIESVSVEKKVDFVRELYIGITWDYGAKLPVALLSLAGGVEVESLPSNDVIGRKFDPRSGLLPFEGRKMAKDAGLEGRALAAMGNVLHNLSRAFLECDAEVAEINPIVEITEGSGSYFGLDAHMKIDDDAVNRQESRLGPLRQAVSTTAMGRPPTELELEAQRIDEMDYRGVAGRVVEFDGDLALLIGGGGASLTIFDAIRRHGGRPANYCEVGGNPTEEKVAALTALLLTKPGVRQMAVIMNVVNNTRSDVMARGVLAGVRRMGKDPSEAVSLFRIPGSWEDEGRQIMEKAGVKVLGREISLEETARLAARGETIDAA